MSVVERSALEQFEQSVFDPQKKHFADAAVQLHHILANIEKTGGDIAASSQQHYYPRLAGAISALFLDEEFGLTLDMYRLLCASHSAMATVFACTTFQNADHIISHLADVRDINNIRFSNVAVLMKCLLCYSLYSSYNLDIRSLSGQFPEIVASLVQGHLGYDLYSRPEVEIKINRMLAQSWPVLGEVTPTLPMVLSTSNAWMNCSYASIETKHLIKRDLNAMICNGLKARGLVPERKLPYRGGKQKPNLVVPVEIFSSEHAMFRCFSRVIEKMSDTFNVTGVAPANTIDEEAERIFPRVIKYDPAAAIMDLNSLVTKIEELTPDIIYYPSLGMANTTLLLANLRLAPIQCFTLGHPATSYIDAIDYVIVQEQDFTTADIYSEKVVLTGNDTSPTINRVLETVRTPTLNESPPLIRIAVTSKQMKINHSFLACCRAIAEQASRPVEFHFFPGVTGYLYEFVSHEILRMLPDSTIYPATDYETYIRNMDTCDVRLGTFPFGGANTNMDCFGLGIPFIILDGVQPHSHSDTAQLKQAQIHDWLTTDSVDGYIESALRLINNDAERVAISRQMMQLYSNDFFYKQARDESIIFDQTLMWIYRNHEAMQSDEKRVWTLADQGLRTH